MDDQKDINEVNNEGGPEKEAEAPLSPEVPAEAGPQEPEAASADVPR
ncbi:MAG: hypothetical protein KJ811_05820 [Candidatus Margulisbacteria bacterium]|nr:hypothetical protein [Candidatus Margulisiibacteriota bacterium]